MSEITLTEPLLAETTLQSGVQLKMSTPAVTVILAEIGLRLANITTDNGYHYTIKKIEEAKVEPFNGYDLPAVNYWCTNLSNERSVYNDDNRSLELFVEIFALTRDETFTKVVGKLAADVVTGLTRATTAPAIWDVPDYDLNETISDFIFDGYDYLIGQGQEPWCGALVKFTIKYQTNPFEMSTYGA